MPKVLQKLNAKGQYGDLHIVWMTLQRKEKKVKAMYGPYMVISCEYKQTVLSITGKYRHYVHR